MQYDEAEIRRTYEYNPHVTSTDFEETLVSVFDAIENAPSIDLVRCGECKYCDLDVCVEKRLDGYERYINICKRHTREWVVNKDWFCADGERRENAEG